MKKRYKRFVSFLTATVMFSNLIPIDELANLPFHLPKLPSFSTASTIKANAIEADQFTPGQITFNTASDFADYCSYYADDDCTVTVTTTISDPENPDGEPITNTEIKRFAVAHQNDILFLTFGSDDNATRGTLPSGFIGLGNDDVPFNGEVHLPDNGLGYFKISTYGAPLFSYVNDSVKILSGSQIQDTDTGNYYFPTVTIQFERLSNVGNGENNPLFAQYITNGTAISADWDVELVSSNSCTYSGVIGDIASGAVANLTFTKSASTNVVSNADVGAICGTMQTGSTLNLSFSETSSAYTITSASGNAGGLVGVMNGTSTLNITAMPTASTSKNVVATTGYAGGLVGSATSEATISYASEISVAGNVTGASGAGGLFGHYTNTATAEFDLANYDNSAVVSGTYCGGVFGVLENTASSLTIKKTSNTVTFDVKSGTTANTSGYFGGIAGKYTTNALANSLILDGIELTAEAQASYGAFGGAIGIADSVAYIQTIGTITVNATGTSTSTTFGGLVGETSASNGVFIDLGSFTLNADSSGFMGGGVVGNFHNGVLRLSGTTDMTNGKPASADNCGQLVGSNDNVLVYAPGSGWTFKRSSGALADDLGTWGEVVRGIGETTLDSDAVCFSSTDHTVTISSAVLSMSSANDFIRTALNIQLNQGICYDCLLFTSGSANTRSTLLASSSLKITGNIDLSGSGITGFMRDGGAVNSIGNFTGTLDGTNGTGTYTVTLAIGEKYGYGITASSTGDGIGQIYRHKHNGLFSVLSGTVSNLTVAGEINVSNCVDGMNIGGVASRNGGAVTLTKVIANETINYNESTKVTGSEDAGKNIGGYIGFVGTNGNITINGVSSIGATFNLSGSHESWNVYGGAIGKITAAEFTVNVGDNTNKLTNSLTVTTSDITAASNGDGGGLIGHITNKGSYGSRIVNLNKVEFSNCTIANAATTNGGGFLGYSWLNTTTNVKGVTVTSGTITNPSPVPNVGVLLYSSTGKMIVDSLEINGLTMSSGGGTSLGMIVNKAYDGSNGLYLDVLNAGYSLTCTAPTSASGVFDEIAAYSASDVLSGGAGVISINMNANRTVANASFKTTGTYQNRLKTGNACSNSKARYYYNVDKMSSTNAGQNLVLWSLKKYAASNISSEFNTSIGTTLNGTADLTGLSFYPLKNAGDYKIGNLTLTFDYSGIYTSAETVSNGDSYIRDPGLTNQHYLMHSGLFLNLPTGKTITVSGDLVLKGTFLSLNGSNNAVDGYSGVLISKTMNGSFVCDDASSIKLDGIKPMTTGNEAIITGYLLINNITRESDLVDPPVVNIKNLYTGTYSGTLPVASSLLGAAEGNDLTIKFSHIKLDARTTALSGNSGLDTAYGTSRSIFNDATLLHSINTNQTAILEYYYTYAEDWEDSNDADAIADRFVTYGKEVRDSAEYRENNVSLENKYSGANRSYTNPESSTGGEYAGFSSGWLRYVAVPFTALNSNGMYFRELKVNVEKNGPLTGCGTYNHPYVIIDGDPLSVVAKFISSGTTSDMQKVRLPLDEIVGISNNASGNRWCSDLDDCAQFELASSGTNSGKYIYSYLDKTESTSSSSVTALEGDTDSITETYSVDTTNKTITYVKTTITISDGIKTTNIKTVVYNYNTENIGEAVEVDGGVSENTTRWTISESDGTITKVEESAENNTKTTTVYDITVITKTWEPTNVRLYLANAYYQIGDSTHSAISLNDGFVGLGGTEANYAFRGVIVGYKANSNASNVTVTNNTNKPFINVSNGSVVKNIDFYVNADTITLSQSAATNNSAYFGYNSQCSYYGGIIGEIMGGDNIIDNSYVKYSYTDSESVSHTTTIELIDNGTNKYGTIIPVGGYVGVVVFGGLIFKNMTANKTTPTSTGLNVYYTGYTENLADNDKYEDWAAIYVNPIVGRVINGYAVNEANQFSVSENGTYHDDNATSRNGNTHTLQNGKKHYSIADIKKSETQKLSFGVTGDNNVVTNIVPTNSTTDGTINIPNSQAFFILSLITQSCAGTAQTADGNYNNSLSYGTNTTVFGMSHIADYTDVGKANIDTSNTDYGYARVDTAANTAVPYIIRWYTEADSNGKYPARCATSTLGYYDVNLKSGVSYQLPDSFRGLGSVGNYDNESALLSNKYSVKLDVFDGKGCSIDADMYINKFKIDNYMNGLHSNTNQNVSSTTAYALDTESTAHGFGLFDSVITKDTGKFYNFTLSGSVKTAVFSHDYRAVQEVEFTDEDTLDGQSLYIANFTKANYLVGVSNLKVQEGKNRYIADESASIDGATKIKFTKITSGTYKGKYTLSFGEGDDTKYLKIEKMTDHKDRGHLKVVDTIDDYCYFTCTYSSNASCWYIEGAKQTGYYINYNNKTGTTGFASYKGDINGNSRIKLYDKHFNKELHEVADEMNWLNAGGVCGWSRGTQQVTFECVSLNNLTLNGSNYVGGLLAHSGNNSTSVNVTVKQCSAAAISLNMGASRTNTNPRNAMGAFIGKVKQGKVIVYGTASGASNTNTNARSTVTIKSFTFGDDTLNYCISVGGLVGYSGHGFEAYDMYVTSVSGSTVTIGNSLTGISGGIIGVMQPAAQYNSDSYAKFKNCTVENINVTGNMAGGIYGGKWGGSNWVPYRIELDNCKVIGKTAKNTITGGDYAGGLVGHGLVYTRESTTVSNLIINDCRISNYKIVANTNKYSGGFVGYCDSREQSITCYIHDSSVENCIIGQSGDKDYAGGAIGGIAKKTDNNIIGYNIKLDNVTSPSNRMGAWVGFMANDDSSTSIQFTGMAIYGTGYEKNIGSWDVPKNQSNQKTRFVFADYTGQSKTYSGNTVSNYNRITGENSNSVDMPKYPYVNINPQSAIGTSGIISGDGAVLYGSTISGYSGKTGDNTMAAKIFYDSTQESSSAENYSRRYTSFVDSGIPTSSNNTGVSIEEYLKHDVGTDGDRISTYQLENGSLPSGVNDFAVIVIANTDNTETTNLINRYIQLVTNTATDYTGESDYYSIVVNTCKYQNSAFEIVNEPSGLTWTEPTQNTNGSFSLNGAFADSNRSGMTFSLVDVQFKDPFDSSHTKIAYHLYVPVYTVKQITFGFSAAALTDTNSVSYSTPASVSDYEEAMEGANRLHVDSLETWVTQYIRFTYTAEDLNILLSGNDVKWNHNKYVTFDTQPNSSKLPDDTYMVLVDSNGDSDKVYYASASEFDPITTGNGGWLIELTNFNRIKGNDATAFSVRTFNQMIAKAITPTSNTNGLYKEVTFESGYTITDSDYDVYRIDTNGVKHYYKLAVSGDTDRCDLSVPNNYVLNEDYYISMYVPKINEYNNELYYYTINSPELLTGTKSAARTSNSTYNVLVADLYEQTTTYTLTNTQEQITDTNNHIDVSASTTIHLTNNNAAQYLNNKHLHQAFDVLLNCYGEDGSVINEIAGYDDENSTATYKIGSGTPTNCTVDRQDNYILFKTTDVMSDLLNANGYTITVSADISMKFSDIEAEFPEKTTSNPGIGVNVSATSNLAYEATRLPYTSMSKAFDENTLYYYRESVSVSILSYKAVKELDVYDTYGKDSKNYSRLGINGKTSTGRQNERTAMLIDSEAILNASAIEDSAHATTDKIRLTLTLNKKTDTKVTENEVTTITKTDYVKVSDISDYLSDISVSIGGTSMTKLASSTNDTFIYEADISPSDDKVYTAEIEYYVITGSGFTEYANYQVVLQAELLDSNDATIGNKPSDYLVYTNAKVYPTVIEASKLTG